MTSNHDEHERDLVYMQRNFYRSRFAEAVFNMRRSAAYFPGASSRAGWRSSGRGRPFAVADMRCASAALIRDDRPGRSPGEAYLLALRKSSR